jgi:hypothetical protein
MRNENPVSMVTGGIKKGVAAHCILLSREPFLLSREPIYMVLLRGGCNVLQLLLLFQYIKPMNAPPDCKLRKSCLMALTSE